MPGTDSNKAQQTNSGIDSLDAIDVLAIFAGFLSVFLTIAFTTVDLLTLPQYATDKTLFLSDAVSLESVVFFGVFTLSLTVFTLLNDVLITNTGRKALVYGALIAGLMGAVLCFIEAPSILSLALMALAISILVIIWGAVLSTVNSLVLVFMLMLACVFVGVSVLTGTFMDAKGTAFLLSVLSVVCWLTVRRISRASLDRITFASRLQSKERYEPGRGNRFALILIGAMFGAIALLVRIIEFSQQEAALTLGICLLLAGLVIALFYRNLHSNLGDIARRLLSFIMIAGLVPFLFLGRTGQFISLCFLFVAGTISFILTADSILETSRFNQISPFWIIGVEGSVFLLGVLLVLAGSEVLMVLFEQGLEILIILLVGVSTLLQIYINNQVYPLFSAPGVRSAHNGEEVQEARDAKETSEDSLLHSESSWWGRIDAIADEHRLSLRQKEIMVLLIKGWDLAYITAHFSISRSTAKTHVSNLYRKMNIHSKQELIDLMDSYKEREGEQLS